MRSCTNKSKDGYRKGHAWKGRGALRYCESCGLIPRTGERKDPKEMESVNNRLSAEHPELYMSRRGQGRSRRARAPLKPNEYMEGSRVTNRTNPNIEGYTWHNHIKERKNE